MPPEKRPRPEPGVGGGDGGEDPQQPQQPAQPPFPEAGGVAGPAPDAANGVAEAPQAAEPQVRREATPEGASDAPPHPTVPPAPAASVAGAVADGVAVAPHHRPATPTGLREADAAAAVSPTSQPAGLASPATPTDPVVQVDADADEEEEEEEIKCLPDQLVATSRFVTVPVSQRVAMVAKSHAHMAYSSDGLIALVGAQDKGDVLWFCDAISDPLGEPQAPFVHVTANMDSTPADLSSSAYIVRQTYNSPSDTISALTWGPMLQRVGMRPLHPLAVTTVEGRLGCVSVVRKSDCIVTEKAVRFFSLGEEHVTSVTWRPCSLGHDTGRVGLLVAGFLNGSLRLLQITSSTICTAVQHLTNTLDNPRAIASVDWVYSQGWDHVICLNSRSGVRVWQFNEARGALIPFANLPPAQEVPVQCPIVLGVLPKVGRNEPERLAIYRAQMETLIEQSVLKSGVVQPAVKRATHHTEPISSIAVSVRWIVTAAYDGKVLLHGVDPERDDAASLMLRLPPSHPSPDKGIRIYDLSPAKPVSIAFSPNQAALVVMKVQFYRDIAMQKLKGQVYLVPVFPMSAASPERQFEAILLAARSGRLPESETMNQGAIMCSMSTFLHSLDMHSSGNVDWYGGLQVVLDVYRTRVMAKSSIDSTVGLLRTVSALLQLIPPWSRVPQGSRTEYVSPDPLFPATRPAASISVVRTEILRCIARMTLLRVTQKPPEMFQAQEAQSLLNMCRLLASIAARAVSIWIPQLRPLSEIQDEKATGAERLKDTTILAGVTQMPMQALEKLSESLQILNFDLRVSARVIGASGPEGDTLKQCIEAVRYLEGQLQRSCETMKQTGKWVPPPVSEEDVSRWAAVLRALKLRMKCQLCTKEVLLDMSRHTLVGLCPSRHVTQLCPLTLLQQQGVHVGSHRGVCLACATAVSYPAGTLCVPPPAANASQSTFQFLQIPRLTGCVVCGYRLSFSDTQPDGDS